MRPTVLGKRATSIGADKSDVSDSKRAGAERETSGITAYNDITTLSAAVGHAVSDEEFSIAGDARISSEEICSEETRIADGERRQGDRAAGLVKEVRVAADVDRSRRKHAAAQSEL